MITCPFCGLEFTEEEAVPGCGSCPLQPACGRLKCPRCGYEVARTPGVIRWLKAAMRRKRILKATRR
ncbi:MAG: hypothetical protein ACPLTR_02280 [Thermacetogeniaceae bacterium]